MNSFTKMECNWKNIIFWLIIKLNKLLSPVGVYLKKKTNYLFKSNY